MPKTRPDYFTPDPFDYHDELELTIDTLTNLGLGLGRHGSSQWVVQVAFALPGERVRVRVFRNHGNYSEADLVHVIEPSPERVEPLCPLFGDCGGCQYQNLAYPAQLRWKRRQTSELLEKMGGIEFPVDEVVASPRPYGYRSKITPHFRKPRKGVIGPIGFLRHSRRHQLVDVPECPIASKTINEELGRVRDEISANAASYKRGATLLLRDSADGRVCTVASETCLEKVGNLEFAFHAGEFFQNNPHILPAFVDHVIREARGEGETRFLADCYCGSGLFCLSAASSFEQAIGIEISESSIDWARRNGASNGIENCRFIAGDASDLFKEITFPPGETAVVIDPPRKGCTPEFLDQMLAFAPSRVVYVSCNPATQIRDLTLLQANYEITKITPFDLFPQTRHLECVATLKRKESAGKKDNS